MELELSSNGEDTWLGFTAADKVETCCVHDAGLASSSEVQLKSHFEEHKCRVYEMLIQLQHVAKVVQTLFGCI